MTIYAADYSYELAQQDAAYAPQNTAVVDQVAEVSNAVAEPQESAPESAQDQVASASNELSEPSDKELNFRALRDSMAELKAEREAERARYQQELDMLKQQVASVPKQEQKRALDDQSDDDLLTVGKYRQTVREMQEQHMQELQQLRIEQEEMKARVQYSDYDEVMEKYSIPLLKTNRDFARAFQASENKATFAYELGLMAMAKQNASQPAPEPVAPEPSRNAQRMVENARKPGTLSNARGGQASLSKADYWATCSEADFQKELAKNLAEV